MNGKGICYDSAMVEMVSKTIKTELVWRASYPTRRYAEISIDRYIDGFCNSRRRHFGIGYKSPIAYEAEMAKIK